jgi:hypothetical protein
MTGAPLTHPTTIPPGMSSVLDRNMQKMRERREKEERRAKLSERISDRVTAFAGSMTFVGIQALAYGAWIAANLGVVPGIRPFDPSFVMLAMEASVEAIFLSTFVLISQNRMMGAAAKQSDFDLQINLLTEHEPVWYRSSMPCPARWASKPSTAKKSMRSSMMSRRKPCWTNWTPRRVSPERRSLKTGGQAPCPDQEYRHSREGGNPDWLTSRAIAGSKGYGSPPTRG